MGHFGGQRNRILDRASIGDALADNIKVGPVPLPLHLEQLFVGQAEIILCVRWSERQPIA
jgi:hypothetical protein